MTDFDLAVALDAVLKRMRATSAEKISFILFINCDFCGAKLEATRSQAYALGWRHTWVGRNPQRQQDKCGACREARRGTPLRPRRRLVTVGSLE